MKYYLGVTNYDWYLYLRSINPEDVNFWQPGGNVNFKVLAPGDPFLFKLKSPKNAIGGVGFFSSQTFLPISVAWDIFETRNGCQTFEDFRRMILNYRLDKNNLNPTIGCIVLTNPIFFNESDWIETPTDWNRSIVQGKSYSTEEPIGRSIWDKVNLLISEYSSKSLLDNNEDQFIIKEPTSPPYGNPILINPRIGQGAFRVLITDAYNRKCAITGEKTLPVLESAHIKPYSQSGPNSISNGILLRSDVHKLFDSGYITITPTLKIEVSSRIKAEFENGKEYYQYHGKDLLYLPQKNIDKPNSSFIEWHNSNIYRG